MAVLNTTSPADRPRAPMERPRNTDPSARTRTAESSAGTANSRIRCEKAEEACAPPAHLSGKLYRASYRRPSATASRALLKAKHVVHVVEPRLPAPQELGGPQGAQRVGHPALRADGHLDPLPGAGKDDRVLADDVAAADGMETDLLRRARPDVAFAAMLCFLFQISLQCRSDDFAQFKSGARGRVHLLAMVRLDDFDVVAVAQDTRCDLGQFEHRVHPHREIRRHRDRDLAARLQDGALQRIGEPGGAYYDRLSELRADLDVFDGAFGAREINKHVARSNRLADVRSDLDAANARSYRGAALGIERGRQRQRFVGEHAFDERLPHLAAGAGNHDLDRRRHRPIFSSQRPKNPFSLSPSAAFFSSVFGAGAGASAGFGSGASPAALQFWTGTSGLAASAAGLATEAGAASAGLAEASGFTIGSKPVACGAAAPSAGSKSPSTRASRLSWKTTDRLRCSRLPLGYSLKKT